jgi:hypothetical protein
MGGDSDSLLKGYLLGDGPVHGMHTDMRRAPLGAVPSDMQARRETGC